MTKYMVLAAAFMLAGIVTMPARAQLLPPPATPPIQLDNIGGTDQRRAQPPAVKISERQAVELARQHFPGNVLRISLVGQGANLRYQLRMENEGKVFTVFVDANSGVVSGGV